jgi:hypothetical protein
MDPWKQLHTPHCSIFEYMWALKKCQVFPILLFLLFVSANALAQTKVLRGVILDVQSGERIPFASMRLDNSGYGKLSDSAGGFIFHFAQWPRDTLQISYVGYQTYSLILNDSLARQATHDSLFIVIQLQRGKYINEVVVSRKVDFVLLIWLKFDKHK